MVTGNIIVFLSVHGLSSVELECCMDLQKRLEATLKIFEKCRQEFHERGFSVIISGKMAYSKPERKCPVSKVAIRNLLIRDGIPERCITYVEEFSCDFESSVSSTWKYHIRDMMVSQKNPVIYVVSQSLDAYMLQQMLQTVSNGACQAIVKACQYTNWRTFLAGVLRFVCHKAGMTDHAIRAWKQINVHRS